MPTGFGWVYSTSNDELTSHQYFPPGAVPCHPQPAVHRQIVMSTSPRPRRPSSAQAGRCIRPGQTHVLRLEERLQRAWHFHFCHGGLAPLNLPSTITSGWDAAVEITECPCFVPPFWASVEFRVSNGLGSSGWRGDTHAHRSPNRKSPLLACEYLLRDSPPAGSSRADGGAFVGAFQASSSLARIWGI